MGQDLTPAERRFQMTLSTIFCVSVSVLGAFLIAVGIIQWASGEVIPIAGIANIVLGGIFGYFIGARPALEPVRRTTAIATDPCGGTHKCRYVRLISFAPKLAITTT